MRIVTANVTGWETAKNYLQHADAEFIMLQEVKATDAQADGFRAMALRRGLAFKSSAALGVQKRRSAGVMVAWRRHMAVNTDSPIPENERFVAVQLKTQELGQVLMGSLYLHQGVPYATARRRTS